MKVAVAEAAGAGAWAGVGIGFGALIERAGARSLRCAASDTTSAFGVRVTKPSFDTQKSCGAAVVTVQESSSVSGAAVRRNVRKRSMKLLCHTKPPPWLEGRHVVARLPCDARAGPLSV